MNAAYLLLTSALMVGQAPVIQASHRIGASCDNCAPASSACSVDPCCESLASKLRGRLKGMFHRDCAPCAVQTCDPCPPKLWKWDHCTTQTCDPCGHSGLLGKLKGMFHRSRDCACDGGCSSPACATSASVIQHGAPAPIVEHGAPVVVPAQPVIVEPAKKMPAPPVEKAPVEKAPEKKPADPKKVQAPAFNNQAAPAALIIENAPAIQRQPVQGVLNRDPF